MGANDSEDPLAGEPPSARVDEEGIVIPTAPAHLDPVGQVGADGPDGRPAQEHQALAAALAGDQGAHRVEVQVGQVEVDQLADPHGGAVEGFQQRPVAPSERRISGWRLHQPDGFVHVEGLGEAHPGPGGLGETGGVVTRLVLSHQEPVKAPHRGQLPSDGGGTHALLMEACQEAVDQVGRGGPVTQVIEVRLQVAPVGGDGVVAQTPLDRQDGQVAVQMAPQRISGRSTRRNQAPARSRGSPAPLPGCGGSDRRRR